MSAHIVQSSLWGEFKSEYGTPAIRVGETQYTKHHIPFTDKFFGYCPKVDPTKIDFNKLEESLKQNNCININFDVPNVVADTAQASAAIKIFDTAGCVKSPRDQFAKSNVILDLSLSEDALLQKMHHKHRYNIKYAQKNGVTVKGAVTQEDFDTFWRLFEETSIRQHYYVRPKSYYQKIWNKLHPAGIAHILTTFYNNTPLASWMLFVYDGVLYYPYGGSSEEHKNLFGSVYIGWQAILFGKNHGCKVFDMWGASENPDNTSDPWWGFTNFKLKFGGTYIKYIDSYDFVVNHSVYKMFSVANDVRWKVLKLIK